MAHNEHTHHKNHGKTKKYGKTSNERNLKTATTYDSQSTSHTKQKNHKFSKLKHFSAFESEYLGAKRLTNRIGRFRKSVISDSISRIEKTMSKQARAQVNQDLKEILGLKQNDKYKHHQKHKNKHKTHAQNLPRSVDAPAYFCANSGFASTSWEDKLQKSAGVNSVLASVCKQNKSLVQKEILLARKILTQIYPFIKEANHIMFPNVSNNNKIKSRLLQIKSLFDESDIPPQQSSVHSSEFMSSQLSVSSESKQNSQSVIDDFELNPIFTADAPTYNHVTEIFPPARNFDFDESSSLSDIDSLILSNSIYESEIKSCQSASSSKKVNNSVIFVPSSPTSSENSPSWKLKFSPVVFNPQPPVPSPKIYYRRKMF